MIDPNIAKPTMNPAPLPSEKVRLRNRRIGMIGSLAWNSTQMNRPASTTPTTKSPMIVTDPHAYSTPPQESASSTQTTAETMSAAPR
jgi:hypothetical protein